MKNGLKYFDGPVAGRTKSTSGLETFEVVSASKVRCTLFFEEMRMALVQLFPFLGMPYKEGYKYREELRMESSKLLFPGLSFRQNIRSHLGGFV